MENNMPTLFLDLANKSVGFIPKLLAGIALLVLGFLVAWFVKRLVIQLSIALRLQRFMIKFRWGRAFSKADVRQGFYNFIGNIFYFFIILAFIDLAFIAWDLAFLSALLGEAISLFPRVAAAAIILGLGWFVAVWAAAGLLKALQRENVEQARFVGIYARVALIVLFSAMALVILDVAVHVVIIGFTTIFVTMGLIAVVLVALNGKAAIGKPGGFGDRREENGKD